MQDVTVQKDRARGRGRFRGQKVHTGHRFLAEDVPTSVTRMVEILDFDEYF